MTKRRELPVAFSALTLLLFFTTCLHAQNIRWNTAPRKGFVFQINNTEAQKLLTLSSPDTIFNGLLHTLVDTFDVEKGWINRPAKGHFILAKIVANKVHCEYTGVFPYQVFLLKAYDALSLQVLDLNGNVREDAKVKFKLKRLRADPESKTYRLENEWFHGENRIVTVELDGFRSVFNIRKHEVPYWYNNYDSDSGPSFYGYMITDKNKYKPGEKVRFKSYSLSQSRSPLRKDLEVWLISNKTMKVGQVTPHRPGSFAGEFQLHDSLKLTLDRNCSLELREKNGRVVASCSFRYEDYEVHGNKLEVLLATNKQFHPAGNTLTITATDVNGLILKDARANILVKTHTIRETFQPLVMLPDTLLYTEMDLNPNGATTLDIPSHLFEKTNTTYVVQVAVRNSQNQRMERTVSAMHYYAQYELTTRFSNDSIIYEVLNNGVPMKDVPVRLRQNGEATAKEINLPYGEKLNPAISTIHLEGDLVSRQIAMRNLIPWLELEGGIQKDSFNIRLHNPQKLEVSWYVYQGSTLIQKGFGKDMEYKSAITDRTQTYYVELLYSFGGEEHIKRRDYEFRESYLNVSLDIPERVYPGQQAEATIQVTDQLGDPVNGADLTALAVTAKLNYHLPDLPYYGSSSTSRSMKAHYSKSSINKRSAILDLDYGKWERLAGLDTMKYYQFTYPGSKRFSYTDNHIADSTQFAPYVMQGGRAKQVFVIEVNRKPVYYSWVDQPKEYSFYVSPARKNEISLRLYDRVLVLDSISFEAGKKTIFSIDLDHLPENIKVYQLYTPVVRKKKNTKETYPSFTQTEISRHLPYISAFRRADGNTYLESGREFTPLFREQSSLYKETIVAGPVTPGRLTYAGYDGVKTIYQHTGGFTYAFEDNIVYKMNAAGLIPDRLENDTFDPMTTINGRVMTKSRFLEQAKAPALKWHTRVIDFVDHTSRITVLLPEEKGASGIATFLFENCKTGETISPCRDQYHNRSDFYTIPRGCHNVIVLYNNGTYLKMDGISLRSFSSVVADLNHSRLHPADSLSWRWLSVPYNNCYRSVSTPIKTLTLQYSSAGIGNVTGTIYDDLNMPLIGANIVIKDTDKGTIADAEGRFSLDIAENMATLVISFIGYKTKETEVHAGSDVSVYMEADIQELAEVVVVGYGSVSKHSVTAALQGAVAGITITAPGDEKPEAREGRQEDDIIREAEQRLYQELLTLKNIRAHFSDVGFWEPRLYTDKHGQSRFTVTFPDDITRWDATVYAMDRNLQTGTVRKSIKSYKPLMAELHVPQFLTQGDSAFFLGKVLNYTRDKTITGKVHWSGAGTDMDKSIRFTDFYTDKLPVYAAATDSITTRYSFTRDDGYLDGEERTVPVVEQGVIRADGTLSILKNGEDVHVKAAAQTVVTVEILNNQLDIYAGEARYLVDYKYACNEQLASKLSGLVIYRMLMQYEGKPFRYDKDVNKIITRLLTNQNQEFLWSWWDVSPNTSYWMSAHILRALKAARDAGYKVDLDIENIVRKTEYKFDFLHSYDVSDADLLHALASWSAKINYRKHIHVLDSMLREKQNVLHARTRIYNYNYPYSLLKEKLLLQEVRQMVNLSYQRDSLLRYKKEGIMGDVRFSDNRPARYWYCDDLSVNAIAYRIVKRDSLLKDLLEPMQMYFLKSRKDGAWNTYHASNVLMSVLPDLIAAGVSKGHNASITMSGKVNGVIDKFPYHTELQPEEELHLHKESGLPLYYMQYVKERVTKAKTGVEGFGISTSLDNDNTILEAGKPVALTATIDVKKDASFEYVMIEVPIPGACSYADKRQHSNSVETHREYFKDRTVIFCENMRPGQHTFTIHLLPRFTGKYMVNPAQVSLMYVPVVNANTDIKVTRVE